MKVTFPWLGPVPAYQALFEKLGHQVIPPPKPTERTVSLGVKYSPEFICFPFKIILGSYLEAIEQGAELIVTSGGIGACRAVYYGYLSEKILRSLGYQVRVIVFDSPFEDFAGFYRQIQAIRNRQPMTKVWSALLLALRLIYAYDHFEKTLNQLRPYEAVPGVSDQKWAEVKTLLQSSDSLKSLKNNLKIAGALINEIPTIPCTETLKIGLVGEIYLVMEGSANHELENKLAAMGVETVRSKYISHFLNQSLWPSHRMMRKTDRYLKVSVGGHEKETIGYIIKYQEMGLDGIIHLMPFGCMPELVTQTIIPSLIRDLDIPILSLSLDEQSGWLNNQVRVEAFVDLIKNRKELLKNQVNHRCRR